MKNPAPLSVLLLYTGAAGLKPVFTWQINEAIAEAQVDHVVFPGIEGLGGGGEIVSGRR